MGQKIPATSAKEVPDLILPTQDYRRTSMVVPHKLHQGWDGVAYGLLGFYRRHSLFDRWLRDEANRISQMASRLRRTSERVLRDRLAEMQSRFRRQERGREEILPDALACMVEIADRTLGLRPYPV